MTSDEIFDLLDGRVVGGQYDEQDEAKELIATFLASVEDNARRKLKTPPIRINRRWGS